MTPTEEKYWLNKFALSLLCTTACGRPIGCYGETYNSIGPARPLGYPRETPPEESPQAIPHRVRPRKDAFPLKKAGWGADADPVGSVDMDPGSPAATTLDPTNVSAEEEVAAIGATSDSSLHHSPLLSECQAYAPLIVYNTKPYSTQVKFKWNTLLNYQTLTTKDQIQRQLSNVDNEYRISNIGNGYLSPRINKVHSGYTNLLIY